MILDAPKIPNEFKRVIVTNTVNIQETNERSVTEVLPDFGLENARRDMIALRVKHGADSPIGHRCSNIIEMMKNGVNPGKQLIELWRLVRAAR